MSVKKYLARCAAPICYQRREVSRPENQLGVREGELDSRSPVPDPRAWIPETKGEITRGEGFTDSFCVSEIFDGRSWLA